MAEQQKRARDASIEPGMNVKTTSGDLGKNDISRPKVKEVVHDAQGNIDQVIIQKGVIFRKEIAVPADRIEQVEPATNQEPGTVVTEMSEQEADALTAQGHEELAPASDPLKQIEEKLPTAEGLRRQERRPKHHRHAAAFAKRSWWQLLGPGFLSGMAGNDASAVGSYSLDGAQVGFAHLWLILLATPLYQAVQYTCAKIGRITGKGLAQVLREHYGRPVGLLASLVLMLANLALMAADLVAISSGIELLTGLAWFWFVIPIAFLLWYLTVYSNFEAIKRIFTVMSLVFIAYLITAILSHPNWGSVLFQTFVPHIDLTFESVSSAVALLGATISPYTMYWQVQGEKEEVRPGKTRKEQVRFAALDIVLGAIGGNLIAYCIMLTAADTLFTHHKTITTVTDAATALTPLLGPFAKYLFAMGFIGAGMVALPVLLASTSYGIAGTIGWPGALSKKPWQNEGFYLILSGVLLVSLILALLRIDPIQLIFWANVLNGVLSPILVIYLLVLGNTRKIMQGQRISWLTNLGLLITLLLMTAATILLFYGLFTGKGGS
jgi:NRAMP (natural resistance-associated macrophage protein)-like metal ion transporter